MISCTHSVAFAGIDVLKISIEVQITNGLPSFTIVGLGDKAIAESRERVRAALHAVGLSLPANHITVNLAPADVVKEGTHFDLPIAIALMGAMGVLEPESFYNYLMMGELGLDGTIRPVSGILPASVAATSYEMGFICPKEQGPEALWSGNLAIVAPHNLLDLMNHLKGTQLLLPPEPVSAQSTQTSFLDMKDIKGQESAKRAMEIAAVGGHNVLMVGPPGSGKSMLAARLPTIMPPLSTQEMLEVSKIHSVAGLLKDGQLVTTRPFRAPHYNASTPAMVGGGLKAKPGEISLAHRGVLFLDELPEFSRQTLEALRQPLETGEVSVARANSHITYPSRFQFIAAMNPCRCGYLGVPGHECPRAPRCAQEYQSKLSGPLLDRIDIQIEVPLINPWQLGQLQSGEDSATILKRVMAARAFQKDRFTNLPISTNAEADGRILEQVANLTDEARAQLIHVAEQLHLSGRGFHRMIRVARTIADMDQSETILRVHMDEALSFRKSCAKGEL
ncbi:MAG: YifB family Mg chelatase-like AAA ATPase [Alphaproteobacteria bacterium]|nr:YifB family Mg chelatase-like AAA ATPase [Alphaproteobacteria bacterium]